MSRQFRTTFRALFLTPIRNTLCRNDVGRDGGELENTDVITGNKSRLDTAASQTKMSKIVSAVNNTSSDTNGLLTTNL